MEKVCYEELRPAELVARVKATPIAYLPLGTLEWHGLHNPLGADGLQSRGFMMRLAQAAGGVVLPMLFLGPDLTKEYEGKTYYGMDFFGRPEGEAPRQLEGSAYWVDDGLYAAMLRQICANLARVGFKIVVGHGHGPSTEQFMALADAMKREYGLTLLSCASEVEPGIQTDHAAENETSITWYFHPDLVDMSQLPPLPERPEGVMGRDPRLTASPELGQKAVETQLPLMTEKLKALLKNR